MNRPGQGRKRTPTKIKQLNGSAEKDPQRINQDEPIESSAVPVMPSGWTGARAEAWQFVTSELAGYGILSRTYQFAIEEFCRAWAGKVAAEELIESQGITILTKEGFPRRNPASLELHKCADTVHRYLTEFGLTPTAKTRIAGKQNEGESKPSFLRVLG